MARMLRPFGGIFPSVPATAYVDPSAQVIGDVRIGAQSSIWMNAVLRGDVHCIRIGARSNVQDCAVLHGMREKYPVRIGNGVSIAHNATVHGCIVEDDVLIGIGAIILNDAHIGAGSIIGAGALVPEHTVIPPRSLVLGVPGRVRRATTDADLELIRTHAANYVDYTHTYLGH